MVKLVKEVVPALSLWMLKTLLGLADVAAASTVQGTVQVRWTGVGRSHPEVVQFWTMRPPSSQTTEVPAAVAATAALTSVTEMVVAAVAGGETVMAETVAETVAVLAMRRWRVRRMRRGRVWGNI